MTRRLSEFAFLLVALAGLVVGILAIPIFGWLDAVAWLRAERRRRAGR